MSCVIRPFAIVSALSLLLSACGGGGGGYGGGGGFNNNLPVETTPGGTNDTAFMCPTSDTTFSKASANTETRRTVRVRRTMASPTSNILIVSYATRNAGETALTSRIASLGATS